MDNEIDRRSFLKSAAALALCIPTATVGLSSCGGGEKYTAEYFKDTVWKKTSTRPLETDEKWLKHDISESSTEWKFRSNGSLVIGIDTDNGWTFENGRLQISLDGGSAVYSTQPKDGTLYYENNKPAGKVDLICLDRVSNFYDYGFQLTKI